MLYSFFSKTDNRPKQRFFNPPGILSTDETSASSGQDRTSIGMPHPGNTSTQKIRLIRSTKSLEDLLEILLKNADSFDGLARENYLEQMLLFLKRNPDLVNKVPNKFHSNPLELVLKLGNLNLAKELLAMRADVRPENRKLLKDINHLLQPLQSKRNSLRP